MFTSKQAMTAREVESAHAKLAELLRQRDHWYDGTVASVDARLAAIRNALPAVERVASIDNRMLDQAERLRAEHRSLVAFRREALSGTDVPSRPQIPHAGPLTREARRFIATEMRHFLADNADALGDEAEMDERAKNHADIATLQLPVPEANSIASHFRRAVNWEVRNRTAEARKRPQPQARTASVDDLPDEMLFG